MSQILQLTTRGGTETWELQPGVNVDVQPSNSTASRGENGLRDGFCRRALFEITRARPEMRVFATGSRAHAIDRSAGETDDLAGFSHAQKAPENSTPRAHE